MLYTRRDVGKIALAAVPLARGLAAINSKFNGVQIGAITHSFRQIRDLDEVIKAMVQCGLGETELMSDLAESAAGAPSQGGRGGGGRAPGRGPGGGPGAGAPGTTVAGGALPPSQPGSPPPPGNTAAAPGGGGAGAPGGGRQGGGGGGRARTARPPMTEEQITAAR